jgi:FMN phosphatase YigB (HAD superfamily)
MTQEQGKLTDHLHFHPMTLLFDIGNVLTFSNQNITLRWFIEKHGLSPDKANGFFADPAYHDFARGRLSPLQFYHQICKSLGLVNVSITEIEAAHNAHVYAVNPGMIQLVNQLANYGRQIVLVTDTNVWQTQRQQSLLLDAGFILPKVIKSDELGMLKSDPPGLSAVGELESFYTKALNPLGIAPSQAILIDDSDANLYEAQHMGITAIKFSNETNLEQTLIDQQLIPQFWRKKSG